MKTCFDGSELFRARLDQKQCLARLFDLALPSVDGLNRRDQRSAGGQPLLNQGLGDALGLGGAGRRAENDAGKTAF